MGNNYFKNLVAKAQKSNYERIIIPTINIENIALEDVIAKSNDTLSFGDDFAGDKLVDFLLQGKVCKTK